LTAAVTSPLLAIATAVQRWWAPAITLTVVGLFNAALYLLFRKPTRWER
jgi:hypothetical protein